MCKKHDMPEMWRYYPMNRGYAQQLIEEEQIGKAARERSRKFNKERWNQK